MDSLNVYHHDAPATPEQLHLWGHGILLSQLASAHMAHDLASPIGALMTGLELLELPKHLSKEDQELFELLQKSSEMLRSRLDMFRAAYAVGGQVVGVRYARTICHNYFKLHERVTLKWTNQFDGIRFAKGTLQLFINILLWLHSKVSKQGECVVTMNPDTYVLEAHLTTSVVILMGEEESVILRKVPLEDIDARTTQLYLISLLSSVYGYPFTIESDSAGEVCFRLQSKSVKSFL